MNFGGVKPFRRFIKHLVTCFFHYNGDIDLHSFNNGTSLQNKLGNWSLLQRFFIRQELNIPKDVVNGTIHCKQGAAELLVVYIYRRGFITLLIFRIVMLFTLSALILSALIT